MPAQLFIYACLQSESLTHAVKQSLSNEHYVLTQCPSVTELLDLANSSPSPYDCLIVQDDQDILNAVKQLSERGLLYAVVILQADGNRAFDYPAVALELTNVSQISDAIGQAIAHFISLPATAIAESSQNSFRQQQRLAEKLKPVKSLDTRTDEREVFHQLAPAKKQAFLQQLKVDYRQIILQYFVANKNIKQKIDEFIDTAFSSKIPIPHIIEIHMDIIEEFSKKLKVEGRNDDVLLDYRLTLIEILAHLCELYRCSMSK